MLDKLTTQDPSPENIEDLEIYPYSTLALIDSQANPLERNLKKEDTNKE